jgi:predicted HTH transcriptional regulator
LRTWTEFSSGLTQTHGQGVSWMVKSREEWPKRLSRQPLNQQESSRLRIRQLQVLEDLATRGDVGVQDLVSRFGISRASALRDLGELVSLGLLVRTGSTRATRYILKQA